MPGHIAVGDLRGFLHHIAELAGLLEAAPLAVHPACFHRQGGAAHGGPGQAGDHAHAALGFLFLEVGLAEEILQILTGDADLLLSGEQPHRCLADDLIQLLFQVADAGLAGVAVGDLAQHAVADLQLRRFHAGPLQGARPQMVAGDLHFLFGDVAAQPDGFHAVQQRAGNRIQRVGGAHEQAVAEIEPLVQIVVQEILVLFRVQHFQQCRRRVALEGLAQFVDLIQHDHRVAGAGVLERLGELARHGTDVGAAVAFDLRLVAHAAQAETVELPPQGFTDGLADAGLAHAGRPHQQQNRAFHLAAHGAHGQELDNAVLHVVEAAVVLLQRPARVAQVEVVLGVLAPGHAGEPVQIIAGHRVFRRAGFQHVELAQLLFEAPRHRLGRVQRLKPLAEFVGVGGAVVFLQAQLPLDHLELLLEEEFALVLADLFVHFLANLVLQARHFHFFLDQCQHALHACFQRHGFQNALQLVAAGAGQGGGEIGERRGITG